jgi:hypothetical protein
MVTLASLGPVYQTILQWLPWWLAASLGIATIVVAVSCILRLQAVRPGNDQANHWIAFAFEPITRPPEWALLIAGCLGLLLALDGQGFAHGFFRYDDFAFVQDAHSAPNFREYILMFHNDHSLPLYRMEVWALLSLAGWQAPADALASIFNDASLLSFLALLTAGCWALHELGARRLTLACFACLLWFWPGWGEFTSGFYTLIVYPQTVCFGFTALALLARAVRTGARWCAPVAALSVLAATTVDLSGVWTIPVTIGFCCALLDGPNLVLMRRSLWFLIAAGLLALLYQAVWAPHVLIGRELIQNPSGNLVKSSLLENVRHYGWHIGPSLFSGVGGVVLSFFFPPTFEVLAVQHNQSMLFRALFAFLEIIACAITIYIVNRAMRRSEPRDRRLLAAIAWAVVVPVSMVVLARINISPMPGTLWPAKYKCIPYCWLAFGAAVWLDRQVFISVGQRQRILCWTAIWLCTCAWFSASFWQLEKKLALNGPWLAGGRYHNVKMAELRQISFNQFQCDLSALARHLGYRDLVVPPPSGNCEAYRFLELGGNAERGANYSFPDLLSIAPDAGLTLRIVARDHLPAGTLAAIGENPRLKDLFLSDLEVSPFRLNHATRP